MPDVVKESSIYRYADDTVLLNYGKKMINVKNDMPRDLGKIASWCGRKKLSLNIKKTKTMLFGSRHNSGVCYVNMPFQKSKIDLKTVLESSRCQLLSKACLQ